MDFFFEYSVPVVMAICLAIGYLVKHAIPGDKVNRFIPVIVAVIGIFINVWCNAWTVSPEILLGGLASGLASTGAYELVTQQLKGKGDE